MTSPASTESSHAVVYLRVAVGSKNPAKIRAVEQALRQVLARRPTTPGGEHATGSGAAANGVQLHTSGYDVASGVRNQPMGDTETCLGAKNRAMAAHKAYWKQHGRPPHLAFGLEGGLEELALPWALQEQPQSTTTAPLPQPPPKQLYCMAWMAVYGKRSAFTVDLIAGKGVTSYHGDRMPKFGCGKTGSFPIPPAVMKLVQQDGLELGVANDKVFASRESRSGLGAVGLVTDGIIDRSMYYEHALTLAMAPWFRPDVYP